MVCHIIEIHRYRTAIHEVNTFDSDLRVLVYLAVKDLLGSRVAVVVGQQLLVLLLFGLFGVGDLVNVITLLFHRLVQLG